MRERSSPRRPSGKPLKTYMKWRAGKNANLQPTRLEPVTLHNTVIRSRNDGDDRRGHEDASVLDTRC
jgi:hypothetical protein